MRHSLPAALLLALVALRGDEAPPPWIGFRGDGSGVFRDCTTVISWNEWRWDEGMVTKRGKQVPGKVIVGEERRNIVWKTGLTSWGNGHPLLVNGRIYLMQELDLNDPDSLWPRLICLDAASGGQLWSKDIDHLDLLPEAARDAVLATWREAIELSNARWRAARQLFECPAEDHAGLSAIYAQMQRYGFDPKLIPQGGGKLPDETIRNIGMIYRGSGKVMLERFSKILKPHNMWFPAWSQPDPHCPGRWMGSTFATPVSDGERIWIRTGQHALVCCDLDGHPLWKTLITRKRGYTAFAPSLVLCGDLLLVDTPASLDGDGIRLRAFAKATGEKVWEAAGSGNSYSLGLPTLLNLGGVHVVVTAGGDAYRVSDGKHLASQLCAQGDGDNALAQGDLLVTRNAQAGGHYLSKLPEGLRVLRLELEGESIAACEVWTLSRNHPLRPGRYIIQDGVVYAVTTKGITAFDLATGRELRHADGRILPRPRSWLLTIVGDHLLASDHVSGSVAVLRLPDLSLVGINQLGREVDWPGHQLTYGWNEWGVAGGPFPIIASGNRLFVRTWLHVYCIGDPSEPQRLSPHHR